MVKNTKPRIFDVFIAASVQVMTSRYSRAAFGSRVSSRSHDTRSRRM